MFRHDLLSLRLFVAACERGSLSRAAELHHLAVSAASRRLALLEAEAGTPLLLRRPHGMEPTPAGLTMLRYARGVLALGDRLGAGLDEHRAGVRGRVRVFASSSALIGRLAADLARFARENPRIKLDLEERPTSETLEATRRGAADLGVVVRGTASEGLTTLPYARDRLAVALPGDHPLAGRDRLGFAELLDEEFVSLDAGTAVHRLVTERARDAGRFLRLRVQVRSFEVMCHMVGHGLGLGILPEAALRPFAEGLGLRLVPLDEPWAVRHLDLCVRAGTEPDPPAARLLAELRHAAGDAAG